MDRSRIEVALPDDFGHLEIKNSESRGLLIGIVDGNWQIVSDQLEIGESDPEDKVVSYIQNLPNRTKFKVHKNRQETDEDSLFSET